MKKENGFGVGTKSEQEFEFSKAVGCQFSLKFSVQYYSMSESMNSQMKSYLSLILYQNRTIYF